jgi:hypothetical protein
MPRKLTGSLVIVAATFAIGSLGCAAPGSTAIPLAIAKGVVSVLEPVPPPAATARDRQIKIVVSHKRPSKGEAVAHQARTCSPEENETTVVITIDPR